MISPSEQAAYAAILPVIDLRRGQVVRGVAGQRDSYRPVRSCLARGSSPGEIAEALVRSFGFTDVYVADLDAICDGRPDTASLREVTATGLQVWLDAGIGSVRSWQARLEDYGDVAVHRWLVGLETLESWHEWECLLAEIGPQRLLFSLDLLGGKPKSSRPGLRDLSAADIARRVISLGAESLLLLDLAAVGMGQGTATDRLLQGLVAEFPDICLLTGGGTRTLADIERQQTLGARRVLVASALHTGQVRPRFP